MIKNDDIIEQKYLADNAKDSVVARHTVIKMARLHFSKISSR